MTKPCLTASSRDKVGAGQSFVDLTFVYICVLFEYTNMVAGLGGNKIVLVYNDLLQFLWPAAKGFKIIKDNASTVYLKGALRGCEMTEW